MWKVEVKLVFTHGSASQSVDTKPVSCGDPTNTIIYYNYYLLLLFMSTIYLVLNKSAVLVPHTAQEKDRIRRKTSQATFRKLKYMVSGTMIYFN